MIKKNTENTLFLCLRVRKVSINNFSGKAVFKVHEGEDQFYKVN